jgi:hypothetical protein
MNVHVPSLSVESRLSNADCFRLGLHVAHHRSAEAIAELVKLPGGAAQATALAMEWGHPIHFRPDSDFLSVGLSGRHRTKLAEEAHKRVTDLPDLVSLIVAQVAKDHLWAAILDD